MPTSQLVVELENPELDPNGDTTTCAVDVDVGGQGVEFPLHIVFCIDVSGSMNRASKLEKAKEGAIRAIGKLDQRDAFGVVAFAGRGDTLLSPQSGEHVSGAQDAISAIRQRTNHGRGTNITSGLQESHRLFDEMPAEEAVRWVVLLTDGQDSQYNPDQVGKQLASNGLTVHTVGLGKYDEVAVRKTAELTQGNWRHAQSAQDIPEYFENWVDEARGVVVTNPALVIAPGHANIESVYFTVGDNQTAEVDTERSGGEIRVDLADIRRDDTPEILLELDVPPHDPIPDVTLATLRLEAGEETITDSVTGNFVYGALQDPDKHNKSIRVRHALAKVGRTAIGGDASSALAQLESEADNIDETVLQEAKKAIKGVESGDKSATEDVSKLIALPDKDE